MPHNICLGIKTQVPPWNLLSFFDAKITHPSLLDLHKLFYSVLTERRSKDTVTSGSKRKEVLKFKNFKLSGPSLSELQGEPYCQKFASYLCIFYVLPLYKQQNSESCIEDDTLAPQA